MRGAWIEIMQYSFVRVDDIVSRPMRGAWIEIYADICAGTRTNWSRPMRGAWIEIGMLVPDTPVMLVAPHAGRVD